MCRCFADIASRYLVEVAKNSYQENYTKKTSFLKKEFLDFSSDSIPATSFIIFKKDYANIFMNIYDRIDNPLSLLTHRRS